MNLSAWFRLRDMEQEAHSAEYRQNLLGREGETQVTTALQEMGKGYEIFTNRKIVRPRGTVLFATGGISLSACGSFEIDVIAVGPVVLVIEVKRWAGRLRWDQDSGNFYQIRTNGQEINHGNLTAKLDLAASYLRHYLGCQDATAVRHLLVLEGTKLVIEGPVPSCVVRSGELRQHVPGSTIPFWAQICMFFVMFLLGCWITGYLLFGQYWLVHFRFGSGNFFLYGSVGFLLWLCIFWVVAVTNKHLEILPPLTGAQRAGYASLIKKLRTWDVVIKQNDELLRGNVVDVTANGVLYKRHQISSLKVWWRGATAFGFVTSLCGYALGTLEIQKVPLRGILGGDDSSSGVVKQVPIDGPECDNYLTMQLPGGGREAEQIPLRRIREISIWSECDQKDQSRRS